MKLSTTLLECVEAHDIGGVRAYLMNAIGRGKLTVSLIDEMWRLMPDVFQEDDGRLSLAGRNPVDAKVREMIRADLSFNFSREKLMFVARGIAAGEKPDSEALAEACSAVTPKESSKRGGVGGVRTWETWMVVPGWAIGIADGNSAQ